ncbi:MAG: AEC family transporter [Candidatus Didemnitutus sp.]|nr:AEC family transporter [Candidatus Didemnitutus sp.]
MSGTATILPAQGETKTVPIFGVDARPHRFHCRATMLVLNALTPVFLLVVLGMWLQRSSFVSAGFLREANRVTYWLGLPALLFSQLVSSLHDAAGAERLVGAMFLTTALAVLVGYLVAWLLRVPGPVTGTFVQGAFRGNLAFVGLPIIFALPDTPVLVGLSLHAAAVIAIAPTMVLYNIGGVVVLTVSQHTFGPKMIWPILKQLAVTPPLLATLAGIGFVAMGWTLPRSIAHTLEALGEMALPLGLLGVGGSLITAKLSGAWRAPLASALLKSVAGPLLAYAAARWFGLGVRETVMIMILAAAPTAIVSYTMAVEMKGDEKLASATIALSVVTSLVALAVVVSLFPV